MTLIRAVRPLVARSTTHRLGATLLQGGGGYTASVDGQAVQDGTCLSVGAAGRYRALCPLARGLADTAHTVVIAAKGTAPVCIDSLLGVSGALVGPAAGSLVSLGDSVTAGYGLQDAASSWPSRLSRLLGRKLGRPFALANLGVSGDALAGFDSGHPGALYRTATAVPALAPEVLTVCFGINDAMLRGIVPGDYAEQLLWLLCLVEDLFDTAKMAVVVGNPSYLAAQSLSSVPGGNSSGFYGGTAGDNFRALVELCKPVVALFAWCSQAYFYEAMDETDSFVYPNGGFDSTHPNDAGHSALAVEAFRAAYARLRAIGKA